MRRCPACKKYTLDFDDYFSRFRCYNPDCLWMPASSTDRRIRRLEAGREPQELCSRDIPELGLVLKAYYDEANDTLVFEFGEHEPTLDIPEPDGRLVWRVGRESGTVVGFDIMDAKQLGVSQVQIDIAARKKGIERGLQRFPNIVSYARVTKAVVESVTVAVRSGQEEPEGAGSGLDDAFDRALDVFKEMQQAV
jgi:hypothetical protein